MLVTDAHTAALNWATRTLTDELPDEDPSSIADRADMLTAIVAAEGIPIEVLIEWIHTRVPGKEWSGEEWRRFSAKYGQYSTEPR
jgi:hypothetical protein